MAKHTTKKLPKNTMEILMDIPWATVETEYAKAFDTLAKDLTVQGFRKGKAPKEVVEKNLPKDRVYDTMIRAYIPAQYEEIVKEEKLQPIYSPKIELVKAKENENWQVKFTVPLQPEIDLKNYKDIVKKAKEEKNKPEIWTPGKDKDEKAPNEAVKKEMAMQAALNALVDKVKIEISDVILDDEVNRRMSKLVDDIQRLGMTVENYIKAKNITIDQLKDQFRKEIEESYKVEFILQEIGDLEKIQVEKDDLDKMMAGLKDEKDKQAFMQNAYYYATLMRKQKILEHLIEL
jgi:trigger factor